MRLASTFGMLAWSSFWIQPSSTIRAAIQSVTTKTSRPVDLQSCSCGETLAKNVLVVVDVAVLVVDRDAGLLLELLQGGRVLGLDRVDVADPVGEDDRLLLGAQVGARARAGLDLCAPVPHADSSDAPPRAPCRGPTPRRKLRRESPPSGTSARIESWRPATRPRACCPAACFLGWSSRSLLGAVLSMARIVPRPWPPDKRSSRFETSVQRNPL